MATEPCGELSEFGDVCIEVGPHWLHVTTPDTNGMVTAWGLRPGPYLEVACPAGCGLIVGTGPDVPVTIGHNHDGSHSFEADGVEHSVRVHVDRSPHLRLVGDA